MALKTLYRKVVAEYGEKPDLNSSIWQPRYYSFEVFSKEKALEKLQCGIITRSRPGWLASRKAGLIALPDCISLANP